MFGRKKEKEQMDREYRLRANLASRPASVNIEYLVADAKDVIMRYLTAIYTVDQSHLPMENMEEGIFNGISQVILNELTCGVQRNLESVTIDRIMPFEYDNHMFFAVSGVTFDVDYTVKGSQFVNGQQYPYCFSRSGRFIFRNDSRMGWLLSEALDDGPTG